MVGATSRSGTEDIKRLARALVELTLNLINNPALSRPEPVPVMITVNENRAARETRRAR